MDKESSDYAISASFLNPISTSLFFSFFFSRFVGIKYVHGSLIRFFTEILHCNFASLPLFKFFSSIFQNLHFSNLGIFKQYSITKINKLYSRNFCTWYIKKKPFIYSSKLNVLPSSQNSKRQKRKNAKGKRNFKVVRALKDIV